MRNMRNLAVLLALTTLSFGTLASSASAHTLSRAKMKQTAQQMLNREVQRSRQGLKPLADRIRPTGIEDVQGWPSPATTITVSDCHTTNLSEFSQRRHPHVGVCSFDIAGASGGFNGIMTLAFRSAVRFRKDRSGNTESFYSEFTNRHTRSRSVIGWYSQFNGGFVDPTDPTNGI
jgi:hypothetical protein